MLCNQTCCVYIYFKCLKLMKDINIFMYLYTFVGFEEYIEIKRL